MSVETTPARGTSRRDQLVAGATDFVLDHGLIGLSLRPLAGALGTSDRMLLYHFASKDDLVAAVMRESNDRSIAHIRALAPTGSVKDEVVGLWTAMNAPDLDRCQRVYVEAAALGLLGREPYASVIRDANAAWAAALADRLAAAGVPRARVGRAAMLLDAAFMGFQLDLPVEDRDAVDRAVQDLADAIEAIAGGER
jgi:AcrR family transcriptional regulator